MSTKLIDLTDGYILSLRFPSMLATAVIMNTNTEPMKSISLDIEQLAIIKKTLNEIDLNNVPF